METNLKVCGATPSDALATIGFSAGEYLVLHVQRIDFSLDRLGIRADGRDTLWQARISLNEASGIGLSLDEADRQMILMALGRLAVDRPGWQHALEDIARKVGGVAMMKQFQELAAEERQA